jgi:hypothetical protein
VGIAVTNRRWPPSMPGSERLWRSWMPSKKRRGDDEAASMSAGKGHGARLNVAPVGRGTIGHNLKLVSSNRSGRSAARVQFTHRHRSATTVG